MKAVVFAIVSFLFLGTISEVQSQVVDPGRQCKILIKKRQGKYKRSISRRHKAPKKSKTKDFKMAESDGPVLASNSKKKRSENKQQEEKSLAGANVIIFNSMQMPDDDERETIRQEVAQMIANKKDGAPIKLDPLLFKDNNGQLEISDMKPFLTAVEFGLQGRIILIDGYLGSAENSMTRMERVKQLMVNMGVSSELVSITGSHPLASSNVTPRINFTVF